MFTSVMNRLSERRAAGFEGQEVDAGFTLIELMVVLLIMAILLAIPIPTFLGVTGTANDRSAQANLNTALTDGKAVYSANSQSYPIGVDTLAVSINSNEPSLGILTTNTTTASAVASGQLIVWPSSDGNGALYMSLAKKTNECWFIADNTATITANGPWVSATVGLPLTAGEVYGDYLITTTNTTCAPSVLAGLTISTTAVAGKVVESPTGFPANAI